MLALGSKSATDYTAANSGPSDSWQRMVDKTRSDAMLLHGEYVLYLDTRGKLGCHAVSCCATPPRARSRHPASGVYPCNITVVLRTLAGLAWRGPMAGPHAGQRAAMGRLQRSCASSIYWAAVFVER